MYVRTVCTYYVNIKLEQMDTHVYMENTFRSWSTCPSWPAPSAELDRKTMRPSGETDPQVTRPLPAVYIHTYIHTYIQYIHT